MLQFRLQNHQILHTKAFRVGENKNQAEDCGYRPGEHLARRVFGWIYKMEECIQLFII